MKFGTVSPGRYTGTDRYTGVAVGRRSTVLLIFTYAKCDAYHIFDSNDVFQLWYYILKFLSLLLYCILRLADIFPKVADSC